MKSLVAWRSQLQSLAHSICQIYADCTRSLFGAAPALEGDRVVCRLGSCVCADSGNLDGVWGECSCLDRGGRRTPQAVFRFNDGVAHPGACSGVSDPVSHFVIQRGCIAITHKRSAISYFACRSSSLGFFAYFAASWVYVKNKVPLIAWPSVASQAHSPFNGLFSIEWMGVLMLTLIFSPFINSIAGIFTCLYEDVNIARWRYFAHFGTRAVTCKPRFPGGQMAIIYNPGITFPPGGTQLFDRADVFWRTVGGPAWCMLGMCAVLIWTTVKYLQATALAPRLVT